MWQNGENWRHLPCQPSGWWVLMWLMCMPSVFSLHIWQMFFHKIRIISSCISFFALSNIIIYSHPYSQFKIDRYPMILFPCGLEISCCFQFSVIKDRMIITLSFLWMFMCACLVCSSGWGGMWTYVLVHVEARRQPLVPPSGRLPSYSCLSLVWSSALSLSWLESKPKDLVLASPQLGLQAWAPSSGLLNSHYSFTLCLASLKQHLWQKLELGWHPEKKPATLLSLTRTVEGLPAHKNPSFYLGACPQLPHSKDSHWLGQPSTPAVDFNLQTSSISAWRTQELALESQGEQWPSF